jgi:hypothetical protein
VRRARPVLAGALVVAVLTACSASPSSSASSAPASGEPSLSAAAAVECPPIELRATDGSLINLDGTWFQDAGPNAIAMQWWIRSQGECLWASGIADGYTEDEFLARADTVQVIRGRVRDDFTIDGTAVLLGPHQSFTNPPYFSDLTLLIETDDAGAITLREDRDPGVQGPRCPDPQGYCLAPLVLRRQD